MHYLQTEEKIDINNFIFYLFTVKNITFLLFLINLTFVIHVSTTYNKN